MDFFVHLPGEQAQRGDATQPQCSEERWRQVLRRDPARRRGELPRSQGGAGRVQRVLRVGVQPSDSGGRRRRRQGAGDAHDQPESFQRHPGLRLHLQDRGSAGVFPGADDSRQVSADAVGHRDLSGGYQTVQCTNPDPDPPRRRRQPLPGRGRRGAGLPGGSAGFIKRNGCTPERPKLREQHADACGRWCGHDSRVAGGRRRIVGADIGARGRAVRLPACGNNRERVSSSRRRIPWIEKGKGETEEGRGDGGGRPL